jgi:ATP-dependent Clp protease, protease subunit
MKDPIRILEGTARPHEPFWQFRNAEGSDSEAVELEFDGPISQFSWWGDEITPQLFKDELERRGGGKPVTLLVNSPGGDVIAASIIRSALQEYPGKVTADIVGLAASAATIVVTGADHIRMRESAYFMIHNPGGAVMGSMDEIKAFLESLKTVKDAIVDTYQTKTGLSPEKLSKMMNDETWMTAREAKTLGFVDEVVSGSLKKAQIGPGMAGFSNCLASYRNVPPGLTIGQSEPAPETPAANDTAADEREREALHLRDYLTLFS